MLSWQLFRDSRLGRLLRRSRKKPSSQKMRGMEQLATRKDYEPMGIDLELENAFVARTGRVKLPR